GRLVGGLGGWVGPKRGGSRRNGGGPISGRVGGGGGTRSAAVMNIDKAAPTPAARGMSYHRCGEVKARLTQVPCYCRIIRGLEPAKWLTLEQLATFVYGSSGSFAIARSESLARLARSV